MAQTLATTFQRRRFVLKLAAKTSRYRLRGDETRMMTTLADGFLRLGGIYIKFLQGVLLQLPSMKFWESQHRLDVYEDVPTSPLDIHQFLRTHWSAHQQQQLARIESQSFAGGSFGQVYKGQLQTGELIVVKVLRPRARLTLKHDLKLIKFISRLMASTFTNWNIDLKSLVNDFISSTLSETDYISEASFAHEMYETYRQSSNLVIPKTYLSLCNQLIIVQDYIDGLSVAQLLKTNVAGQRDYAAIVKSLTGSDLSTQLLVLGFELQKSVISSRPTHGDPHPGNIRLLPNNKVGLIDFGIRARPSATPHAYYLMIKEYWKAEHLNQADPGEMFLSYIRFYSSKLYDSMQVISTYLSDLYHRPVSLERYIVQLGNRYFKQKVTTDMLNQGLEKIRQGRGNEAAAISVNKVINPDNRFQIMARIKDGPSLRALLTYLNLVVELGYRHLVPKVYDALMDYVRHYAPELELNSPPAIELPEAIETLYGWLEKIGEQDFELYSLLKNYILGLNLRAITSS